MRRVAFAILLYSTFAFLLNCRNPVASDSLSGVYHATTFTLSGDTVADVLSAGGSLSLTLSASGGTSGSLVIPAQLNDGEVFTADLTGTFTVSNDSVHFLQSADTFVQDISWIKNGSQLTGAGTFSGASVTIVLTRQ